MKKYLWLVLAILIPGALYANVYTGESGSLVTEWLWVNKGLAIGNEHRNGEYSLIEANGRFKRSTIGFLKPSFGAFATQEVDGNDTTLGNAEYHSYPGLAFSNGAALTNYSNYIASLGTWTGAGTLTNFAGITFWYDGIESQTTVPANIWGIFQPHEDQCTPPVSGCVNAMKNNLAGRLVIGKAATTTTNAPVPSVVFEPVTFANLTAAPNGTFTYCSDCNPANCTAGASTGSFCKRQNGAWLPM